MPPDRFKTLIEPHLSAAYNLARWLCGNKFDADDIYQEAAEIAYREVDQLRTSNGKAWLLTIVRNCFNQKVRRSRTETVQIDTVADGDSNLLPADEVLIRRADQELVRNALEGLPVDFREVLILREFEDLSYSEIASITGLPIGTVMSRLSRAREKMAELVLSRSKGGRV